MWFKQITPDLLLRLSSSLLHNFLIGFNNQKLILIQLSKKRRNKGVFYIRRVSEYMSCVAQFGIIDEFEKDKDYSCYEPQRYNCVDINDDILNDWWNELTLIKTYFHCYSRPSFALARWGVTLIPPESLEAFYTIVSNDKRSKLSKELIDLMILLRKAISKNKYVIHYGV